MPYGDGTGPRGMGPRTGRGMGNCPGTGQAAYGMGRGFGRGGGRGQRFFGAAPQQPIEFSKDQQVKILEEEKKAIEQELKRLKEQK